MAFVARRATISVARGKARSAATPGKEARGQAARVAGEVKGDGGHPRGTMQITKYLLPL